MQPLGQLVQQAAARTVEKASEPTRSGKVALRTGTGEPPPYFDRYCDIELAKLFTGVIVTGRPREIVRELLPDERTALERRVAELQSALQPYGADERDMVLAEIAAMLSGFRSMRHQGDDVDGIVNASASVLAPFPLWAIAKGCMKIARREAGLNPSFAPNDTEIYGLVDAIVRDYRKTLETIEALLAAPVDQVRALPAPQPCRGEVEARLGRPLQPAPYLPVREGGDRAPDGRHAARVAADLADRKARRDAGGVEPQSQRCQQVTC